MSGIYTRHKKTRTKKKPRAENTRERKRKNLRTELFSGRNVHKLHAREIWQRKTNAAREIATVNLHDLFATVQYGDCVIIWWNRVKG